MSLKSAEILRHFYRIAPSQIRRDIAICKLRMNLVSKEDFVTILIEEGVSDHSPHEVALAFHKQMVRASVISKMTAITEELRLFCVGLAANDVATHACFAAEKEGRLAEVNEMIEEIEKREELGENEHWLLGTGPADYLPLSRESDELYDLAYDTAYVRVLRGYDVEAVAKLYEEDRITHDKLYESGRELIFGPVKKESLPVTRVTRVKNGVEFVEFIRSEGLGS